MQVKPLGSNVLIRPKKADDVTAYGLVIPGSKEKHEGEVIAIGLGKILNNGERSTFDVKVGDIVVLRSWGSETVSLNGEELKIVPQEDILAIIQ
jgi:chaperonin GroES